MNLQTAVSDEQPDVRIQIGLSDNGSLKQFTLPAGPEAYAFNLSIFARIFDTGYSTAEYFVGVIEVSMFSLHHQRRVLSSFNRLSSFLCNSFVIRCLKKSYMSFFHFYTQFRSSR